MVETVSDIPVGDFSALSLQRETLPDVRDDDVMKLVKQLHDAFSTIGFVYLKNHGIPQEQVQDLAYFKYFRSNQKKIATYQKLS